MATEAGPRPRLDPEVFRLPVEKIREGYYTDAYFNFTKELLEERGRHPHVTMQVFQRHESVLGGIDEALAILRLCSGRSSAEGWAPGWDALEIHALHEGDEIAPWEAVMTIEGDYSLFAHLETVYLGSLARRTLVMRNVREVVEAAAGKPIIFFPARHDHWMVQTGDGWAAHVAGAIGVSTEAQASWWGGVGVGTVPHGLIAAYGGDTVAAARDFADRFAGVMNVTVLVDFENDSVRTALEVADALGDKLWGVRLDTSGQLVDRALWHEMGGFKPTGVNPVLVQRVREALDAAGHERVRIVVSGGFDVEKIRQFEELGAPVDCVRRRLGAAARGERLHRRRRPGGRPRLRQGRAALQPQSPAHAGPVASAPVFGQIDHIGVAVEDLDSALVLYRDRLGMPVQHRETVEDFGVEAVLLGIGDGHVELLRPLGSDSPVARFVERNGPGMHHVAYRTDDIDSALESLQAAGLDLIDERPRVGIRQSRVAFMHPKSTGGVLTELVEPAEDH